MRRAPPPLRSTEGAAVAQPCGFWFPLLLVQDSPSVRDGQVMEGLAQSGSLVLSGQISILGIIDTKIPLPWPVGQVSTEEVERGRQIGGHDCYEKSMLPLPVEHPGPCFP